MASSSSASSTFWRLPFGGVACMLVSVLSSPNVPLVWSFCPIRWATSAVLPPSNYINRIWLRGARLWYLPDISLMSGIVVPQILVSESLVSSPDPMQLIVGRESR